MKVDKSPVIICWKQCAEGSSSSASNVRLFDIMFACHTFSTKFKGMWQGKCNSSTSRWFVDDPLVQAHQSHGMFHGSSFAFCLREEHLVPPIVHARWQACDKYIQYVHMQQNKTCSCSNNTLNSDYTSNCKRAVALYSEGYFGRYVLCINKSMLQAMLCIHWHRLWLILDAGELVCDHWLFGLWEQLGLGGFEYAALFLYAHIRYSRSADINSSAKDHKPGTTPTFWSQMSTWKKPSIKWLLWTNWNPFPEEIHGRPLWWLSTSFALVLLSSTGLYTTVF